MPIPNLAGARVLVTGGAGFIGSALVEALLERGAHVRVLDDFSTGKRENLAAAAAAAARVEWLEGDVRDPAVCARAAAGVRYVFHQAARSSVPGSFADPETTHAVNALGTANVLAAARGAGVERTVWASSSAVYGDCPDLPAREARTGAPLSPYAASKQAAERFAAAAAEGQEVIGLRYFNVYGPRQDPAGPYAAVVPRFLTALRQGRPAVICGDGEQTRDFLFVGDAVLANLLAAGAAAGAAGGQAYNVASGRATSIRELAALAAEACGGGPDPEFAPARPGEIRHSVGSPELFQAEVGGFEPVALIDGLRRCLAAAG